MWTPRIGDIEPMSSHRSRGVFAVAGTVLLLAAVTGGCGRRDLPAGAEPDGAAAGQAAATSQPTAKATEPGAPAPAVTPVASDLPAATNPPASSPQPTPAPLVMPDLTAIEQLLADLDAALGVDATADTEEGSAP